jgi:hypothetical protein
MLDPQTAFTLSDLPGIVIYGDDRERQGFYALPQAPRVATDDAGGAQIDLTLYGKRQPSGFVPTGGLFSVTTTLALTTDEDRQLRALLAKRLAKADPEAETPPLPQLLAPEWLTSAAEVRLIGELTLTGQPSMAGANQCSFSINLRAADAKALWKAWEGGLSESRITYRVQLRAAPPSGIAVEYTGTTETIRTDSTVSGRSSFDYRASATVALPHALTLEGPIGLSASALAAKAKTIAL